MAMIEVDVEKLLLATIMLVESHGFRSVTKQDITSGRELLQVDIFAYAKGEDRNLPELPTGWTFIRVNQEPFLESENNKESRTVSFCYTNPVSSKRGDMPLWEFLRRDYVTDNLEANRYRHFARL